MQSPTEGIPARRRVAAAMMLAATALLQGCNGAGERADRDLREGARDIHDYLGARNIRIDTRLPDR